MGDSLLRVRVNRKRVRQLPFWALLASLLLSACTVDVPPPSRQPSQVSGASTEASVSSETATSTATDSNTATVTSTSVSTSTDTSEKFVPPAAKPIPPKEEAKPEPAPVPMPKPRPVPHEPSSFRMPEFDERWGLKRETYEKTVRLYAARRSELENPRFVTVVDFSKRSNQKRLFLFDLALDKMNAFFTSHGKGSDPGRSGMAASFSNKGESNKSSLGAYFTRGTYSGKHGYSLRLQGLDPTNDQAMDRLIVVHGATYVNEKKGIAGRSFGCFALDPRVATKVIDRIKGGSLLFAGN